MTDAISDSPGGAGMIPPGERHYLLPIFKIFFSYYLISTLLPFVARGAGGVLTGCGIPEPAAVFYGRLLAFSILAFPSTILLTLWGMRIYHMTPAEIGWRRPRNVLAQAAAGAGCAFLLWLASHASVSQLMEWMTHSKSLQLIILREELESGARDPALLYLFLTSWNIPAILEEVFFRGLLYSVIGKRLGSMPAVVLVSLLFALEHFHLGGHSRPLTLSTFSELMAAGAVFCLLRESTGNLLAPIAAHGTRNLLATVFDLSLR